MLKISWEISFNWALDPSDGYALLVVMKIFKKVTKLLKKLLLNLCKTVLLFSNPNMLTILTGFVRQNKTNLLLDPKQEFYMLMLSQGL